jgi:hypothetical protein
MNCLDCNSPTAQVPAVAVCHDCGAGVCADHAVVEPKYLTRMVGLGMPVAVEPPGRIIRCPTCANADNVLRNAASYRRRKSRSTSNST